MDEIWNKGTSFPDTKYYYGEPDHSKNILFWNMAASFLHKSFVEKESVNIYLFMHQNVV